MFKQQFHSFSNPVPAYHPYCTLLPYSGLRSRHPGKPSVAYFPHIPCFYHIPKKTAPTKWRALHPQNKSDGISGLPQFSEPHVFLTSYG